MAAIALRMHEKVKRRWAAETERAWKELGRYDFDAPSLRQTYPAQIRLPAGHAGESHPDGAGAGGAAVGDLGHSMISSIGIDTNIESGIGRATIPATSWRRGTICRR